MAKKNTGKQVADTLFFGCGLIIELIILIVAFFQDCFSDSK